VATAVFASSAAADQPTRTEFTNTFSSVLTGVCSFDIAVDSTVSGFAINYFDTSGALTKIIVHEVEQDTFTANGKTLVGSIPFTNSIEVFFDSSGNLTNLFANGVFEKITLPDGSLFVSAGRVDFFDHPGVGFLITPDEGNSGNLAGFCAALAP
jgi:hypothetical protein